MSRSHLPHAALAATTGIVLLCAVVGLAYAAGPVAALEAALNPDGEAYEVNAGADGRLWISDFLASEVWEVQASGSYTVYQGLSSVTDARPGTPGEVWFGNGDSCELRRLVTGNRETTAWSLGSDCNPVATAYDGSRVWVADFANPRLYSFEETGRELCTYTLSGGSPRYFALRDGQVWYGDTTNARIVRLDPAPATPQATAWQLAASAVPFGLAVSPDNAVWWTDQELATVDRFEPDDNRLTAYTLPDGSQPELAAAAGSSLWYTDDQLGVIGEVDPGAAGGTVSILSPAPASVTKDCRTLPAGTRQQIGTRTGTLAWSGATYTETTASGVTTYELGEGSLPWGIASTGAALWVVDRGRQQLIMALPMELYTNKTYLPALKR